MLKKILVLGIAFIMLFSLVSLTACGNEEESMGTFYTLQKAYDDGNLTIDDLKSIAHYQSGGSDEPDIVPIPKNPENLRDEMIQAIKKTYVAVLRKETNSDGTLMFPNVSVENITSLAYFGTYNGFTAVRIIDNLVDSPAVVKELQIAGVTFTYSGTFVTLWKAN